MCSSNRVLSFTESKYCFHLHFVHINKQNWKKSGSGAHQGKEVKRESAALSWLRRCVEVDAFAREEWAARPLAINPRYYPGICQICSLPRQPSVTHSVITSERSRPLSTPACAIVPGSDGGLMACSLYTAINLFIGHLPDSWRYSSVRARMGLCKRDHKCVCVYMHMHSGWSF